MKRILALLAVLLALGLAIWQLAGSRGTETARSQPIPVARGTVIRNATAVGRVEVPYEVPVNSLTGGILTRLFVTLGQKVEPGQPLAEVKPIATEHAILQAERALEQAKIGEDSAREYVEGKHVASYFTRFLLGRNNLDRMQRSADLTAKDAEERLQLLRKGEAASGDRHIDYIVRAPVAGNVIDIRYRVGAPIVPSSVYGSGSEFLTLANLDHLVFRGTVDEIDAGKLRQGMTAKITVGALQDARINAKVSEIGLRSMERNNATVFSVLMDVEAPAGLVLRSGYSAVAQIEVDRRDSVLVLPERLIEFRGGQAFVMVPNSTGSANEKEITTGLSDGLTVEITGGLTEGQQVLERTAR